MSIHSNKETVVEEISSELDPFSVFLKLSHLPYPVFLDSSLPHQRLGAVSYIAVDPFQHQIVSSAGPNDLIELDESINQFRVETLEAIPPFQGGLINLCAYDLNGCFEAIPRTINEFAIPNLCYGLYDTIVAFDHLSGRNWIVSQGFPETTAGRRKNRAAWRAKQIRDLIESPGINPTNTSVTNTSLPESNISLLKPSSISSRVFSNFGHQEYVAAVRRCIEYIYAGDIFQVNLAQRLLTRQLEASLSIYDKLRQRNQATFSAFLDLGEFQILSSSPERLLQVDPQGNVETRPIKGTRQRSCYPEANLFAAEGLITSEKDRAENVMIVDLLRNDLSKFCYEDSIHVAKLCGIENYEYVQHLVSVIRGVTDPKVDFSRVLESLFPGGSITGAPKVRAMEIIAEIERVARGAYCGSLGFVSFDGSMDQNILIRTITASKGWLQIPVGGGIVSQSDPHSEYEETVHKAHGMLRSIL